MKKLSVIIPVYDEEEALPFLYERLIKIAEDIKDYELEILFVNDGSKDKSLKIIKEYRKNDSRVCYLNLSRNFGKEVAMGAAFDYVTGDIIAIIDADLQDPPELIIDMIKFYEQGYDDVYAKRRSRDGETWLKKVTSKKFYKILKQISSVPIQEDTGDFRLLSRRAIEALKRFPERQRYTKGLFSLIGFKKISIEFDRNPRIAGETKWNYLKLMDLAIEGITSFTTVPLRISIILGVITTLISFIYLVYIVIRNYTFGINLLGYSSLIAVILLVCGIQLIFLGIIGEYVGRVFIEVKNRPLYFVDEYEGPCSKKDNFFQ